MPRPSVVALSVFGLLFLLSSVLSIADQSAVATVKPSQEEGEMAGCEIVHSPVQSLDNGISRYIIN